MSHKAEIVKVHGLEVFEGLAFFYSTPPSAPLWCSVAVAVPVAVAVSLSDPRTPHAGKIAELFAGGRVGGVRLIAAKVASASASASHGHSHGIARTHTA